ncbi:hypothetical protein ABBQ38_013450 [Trebouxia sp. C0009 RCD-2024]
MGATETEPLDSKQHRRAQLQAARDRANELPCNQAFELAGRPTVFYELRDYAHPNKVEGAKAARTDVPYLFKSFETGQARPPRPGTKNAQLPRAATIHEYLDWTVTAQGSHALDELDFSGFRTIVLLPRWRPHWPAPGLFLKDHPKLFDKLGAPKNPWPVLMCDGKPVCAATVRVSLGYLEVPFFATHETKRKRGYGRALIEAIEEVARALDVPRLLLCSTDDPVVKTTWRHLGFVHTTQEDLESFGVQHGDLVHMDNTVQMHKDVPLAREWHSLVVRHQDLRQRVYFPAQPCNAANASTAYRYQPEPTAARTKD